MKSYLDLIPVFAKLHRRQTRMTRLCIMISVFLITAIFSMADMFLRSQKLQVIQTDGSWHVVFRGLTEEQMAIIKARPDVKTASRYAVTNYRLDMGYKIGGVQTVVCGFDETFLSLYPSVQIESGSFPQTDKEVLVTESAGERLGLQVGSTVTLERGSFIDDDTVVSKAKASGFTFKVTGFVTDTPNLQKGGAFGIFLNTDAYFRCFESATLQKDFEYYVEFVPYCKIQGALEDICTYLDIPMDSVGKNVKLLALLLQSNDSYIEIIYFVAVFLAVLVAFSGTLMILGSMNSNVAQRTEFFGMIRCLGAAPKQVRKFVRVEALSWCKSAIPAGLVISIAFVWILCGVLKHISPTYFGQMPNLGISGIGVIAGCVVGLMTVLAAAHSPAKKASKVSPLAAVSGNAGTIFAANAVFAAGHAVRNKKFHIDTALGIHHAMGNRKNLALLTCSFGFSIILFLSFSIGIDFMQHALTPLRPYTPDVSVVSPENTCIIPGSLVLNLKKNPYVKRVFGRSFAYRVSMKLKGEEKTVDLISYEEYQFHWAEKDLEEGNLKDAINGKGILLVSGNDFTAHTGETSSLTVKSGIYDLTIAGVLNYAPFSDKNADGMVICSEALFQKITGEEGYTVLDIQLTDDSDSVVSEIRKIAGDKYKFSDQRASNREVRAVYFSFAMFVYGFLSVVALIAAFNIINTTQMSLSARTKQYGVMRAIGAGIRQLNHMVIAETATYCFGGLAVGCGLGIPLHRFLYQKLITSRWKDMWSLPFGMLVLIVLVMLVAAVIAVIGPIRKLEKLSVIDTISSQ